MSGQSKDTARFEEAINVKLLLREICQFIGNVVVRNELLNSKINFIFSADVQSDMPNNLPSLKSLASKVLFALSQNHFGAVFSRVSARLQELSACSDENPDYSDIELIQHIGDISANLKISKNFFYQNHCRFGCEQID